MALTYLFCTQVGVQKRATSIWAVYQTLTRLARESGCARLIQMGTNFRITTTKQAFNVRDTTTCKIRSVIYLIKCRKCHKQYVGETQNSLHICLISHCDDIKHRQTEKPVTGHFNSPGHSLDDLRIAVFEVVRSFDENLREDGIATGRDVSRWQKDVCLRFCDYKRLVCMLTPRIHLMKTERSKRCVTVQCDSCL